MKTICIIPARGGSKGIPGKNIRWLAGKPLITWSIESALKSRFIQRIVVSTDDETIAQISRNWGAESIERPSEISGDEASSESALIHALSYLKNSEDYTPDVVVFLQPTSPLRADNDIDNAIELLKQEKYDSVFSAYAEHFIGRWKIMKNGDSSPVNFQPDRRPRRQESPLEYLENGSIYVFKSFVLTQYGARMGGRIGIYEMPMEKSFQIDVPEDLQLIEKLMMQRGKQRSVLSDISGRIPPDSMIRRITLLALDFDGVLTDNKVWVDQNGNESVCCSRQDSWGLGSIQKLGIKVAVISSESNPVVQARCRKLNIHCESNVQDKRAALINLSEKLGIDRSCVAFAGNDLNDKDALAWAGVSILIESDDSSLHELADWYIPGPGGNGAVRDICDTLMKAHQKCESKRAMGEGVYFIRKYSQKPANYDENYWMDVRDPDGKVRDRLKEKELYLSDISNELSFLRELPGGKVLDIGCGLGFLLSAMDSKWDCHGIEISEFAANAASKYAKVFLGNVSDAAFPNDCFDVVIMHHVIEHMEDPIETLREVRRITRPEGWLILGTPDFDSGCARLFKNHYRLLHDPTHISLFTCESLNRLLRDESWIIRNVDFPFFNSRHFTRENMLRLFDIEKISPPFYGNFMTFYVQKPGKHQVVRPRKVRISIDDNVQSKANE